jgi:hypothetical protein
VRFFDVFNAATKAPGLKASERWLLCVLMSFDGDRGICPRLDTIAARSGFEKGAVLRATKRLEAKGVLSVTRSTNAPNVYTVHLDRISALAPGGETGPGSDLQPGSEAGPGSDLPPSEGLQNATGQVAKRHWAGSETLPDQSLDQSLDLSSLPSRARASETPLHAGPPVSDSEAHVPSEPPVDLLTNPPTWREERCGTIAMTTGRRLNDVAASWAEFVSARADKALPATPDAWSAWVARQIRFDGESGRRGPRRIVQGGSQSFEVDDGSTILELAKSPPRSFKGGPRILQRDPPGPKAYEVDDGNHDWAELAKAPPRKFKGAP